MKIYFSHSTSDYNDIFENECLQKIVIEHDENDFPIEIINPRFIKISSEDIKKLKGKYRDFISIMEKHYFKAIDDCDKIYAFKDSRTKKYTQGVLKEIEYSKNKGKRVIEL